MEEYMHDLLELTLKKCDTPEKCKTEISFVEKAIEHDKSEIDYFEKLISQKGQDFKIQYAMYWKPLSEILKIHQARLEYHQLLIQKLSGN